MNPNGIATITPIKKYDMVQITTHEALLQCWGFVKKGLDRIKARDKNFRSLTHNQIFNAIRFGLPTAQPRTTAVELFVAVEIANHNRIKAFMVTTPLIDPFRNNVPVGINVWFLYANWELIETFLSRGVDLCRLHGGDQIEFKTGRKGWLRYAGRLATLGFHCEEYKFCKEISW
jgi:hypothetical protein